MFSEHVQTAFLMPLTIASFLARGMNSAKVGLGRRALLSDRPEPPRNAFSKEVLAKKQDHRHTE